MQRRPGVVVPLLHVHGGQRKPAVRYNEKIREAEQKTLQKHVGNEELSTF